MSKDTDQSISIIGTSYISPIKRLTEHLFSTVRQPQYKVQAGGIENGYSASIILLWVAMLESFTVRLRYLHGKHLSGKNARNALRVIELLCPGLRHKKSLQEIYVLRDLIIHNHLWTFDYAIGINPPLILKGADKDPNCGDDKFFDRANLKTLRTKSLRLNINPIRIDRYDVIKVAMVVYKTLLYFHHMDYNIVPSLEYRFRYQGEYLSLEDYLKSLSRKQPVA